MDTAIATVRELRLNFPEIRRKIEQHGEVVITHHGVPSYIIRPLPVEPQKDPPPMDYWARLIETQPKPMSEEAANALHELNRGDR